MSENDILITYAYYRVCDNRAADGLSKAAAFLAQNPPAKQETRAQIKSIDDTLSDVYQINADTDDEALLEKTLGGLEQNIKMFRNKDLTQVKIQTKLYEHLYDVYSQLRLIDAQKYTAAGAFDILRREVKNVSYNDSSLNENLYGAFKKMSWFRDYSPKERYKLLLEIKKRTQGSFPFDYAQPLAELSKAYKAQEKQNAARRYQEIEKELQKDSSVAQKIELFEERVDLINMLDMPRNRKFAAKKESYLNLRHLYEANGQEKEAVAAYEAYERFANAEATALEHAQAKGYSFKR